MPSARHVGHRPGTALHPTELTLAHTVPAMAELIPLAEQSRAEAERAIDGLWTRYPHTSVASAAPPDREELVAHRPRRS
jgi:hypothetical protein